MFMKITAIFITFIALSYSLVFGWTISDDGNKGLTPRETSGKSYVIITTNSISANSVKLSEFVADKMSRGFNVHVVTENTWGGGTGNTAAENIRNWLKNNYLSLAIEYVLFIGNPHTDTGDVPMKMLWPRNNATFVPEYKETPSDDYYADLTGNWDLDSDGKYGEWGDDFGVGGVDRNNEVIVGRIPYYGIIADLDSILAKIISYSNETNIDWRNKVLLAMNSLDVNTPGYHLGESVKNDIIVPKGWNYHRMYADNYGLVPSPETVPCSINNFTSIMGSSNFGAVFAMSHGHATLVSDIIDCSNTLLLKNNYPGIFFLGATSSAHPETNNNLSYSLLKNGAVATIGQTREEWYSPGQTDFSGSVSSMGIIYEYANRLISDEMTVGYAMQEMKKILTPTNESFWMNFTGLCLYGDPEISLKSAKSMPSSKDWSQYDSPVKNLMTCGSCWAFSATALVENLGNQAGLSVEQDLSEQVIISCIDSSGCDGGYTSHALEYIRDQGLPSESCYPYISAKGNCADKCASPAFLQKITQYTYHWGLSGDTTIYDLKILLQTGPVIATIRVPSDNSFDFYSGGIYDYNGDDSYSFSASVLVVGYNDDQQYFKVKNNWGVSWGENGYFRIAYNDVTDDVKFGSYAYTASGVYVESVTDTTPPTAPTFKSSVPAANTWTDSSTLTVSWNAGQDSQSGVSGYSYVFDTSASTVPDNTVETVQTQITGPALGDGSSHYFHVRTVDSAGNGSTALHTGPFKIDTSPPTGTVIISNGAASTTAQNVTLTLSANDTGSGVSQMKFSNDNANWSSPVSYSTTTAWTLTSGEGTKTVYASFADSAGNWSSGIISDQITLTSSVIYPPDPTGLLIQETGDSQISLKWNPILSPSGITYAVFRSRTENGFFYKVNTREADNTDAIEGYIDRHLENGITYYYKIQSFLNGTGSQNFSDTVSAAPKGPEDYEIHAVETDRIVNIYGSVTYYIQIWPKEKFTGSLLLTCTASDGLTPVFSLNAKEMGVSLNNLIPPASVSLKITAASRTQTGLHILTLRAVNTLSGEVRDTSLRLTVVSNSGTGIYANVEKEVIPKGEKTAIYGGLFPNVPDRAVILTLDKQGDASFPKSKTLRTDQYGKFRESEWIATLGIGEYHLRASWTDDTAQIRESEFVPFIIEKGISRLSCLRKSSAKPEIGADFSVNGSLFPVLTYPIITLRITEPDNRFSDISVQQNISASWESTRNFFNRRGIWKFRAYWPGNADYIGCESDELIIPVGTDAGRVIILGGGLADQYNTYWQATTRFCTDVYRNFGKKGFTDDMIHLLINSDMIDINWNGQADDDVTDTNPPTGAAFLNVIENEFAASLNQETPLYIYMQGHGTEDGRFKVLGNDEFVTAAQIGHSLDIIQTKTGCRVILILEFCYSGNFIRDISGENRIIVTSAGGEPYNTDQSGSISFSRFLFSKLMEGDSLKKAFDFTGQNLSAIPYPAPALDDNNDGKYTDTDGLLAANTWLTGVLSWGLKPVITEANAVQVLEGASSLPIRAKVTAGDTQTQKVWVQMIAPDANITGGNTTISYPETALFLNPASGMYEGTVKGLYKAGLWKIVVLAEETDHDISDPFVLYVSASGMPGPGDINSDGDLTLADAVSGLRILCGTEKPAADITHADADGDGHVGMEEVIFILRKAAGL